MNLWEPNFMTMDRKEFATRLERTHSCLNIFIDLEEVSYAHHQLNYYLQNHLFEVFMIGDLSLEDRVKLNRAYKDLANKAFDIRNYNFYSEV